MPSRLSDIFSSYPKVWNLGSPAIAEILSDDVLIEEKVDGSFFGAGRDDDGTLRCKSKNVDINVVAPEKLFVGAVETAKSLPLLPCHMYCFEYMAEKKHNAIEYDRVPKAGLVLFDIRTGPETYAPIEFVLSEAERLGVEPVPIFFSGKVTDERSFRDMLDKTSVLGGSKIEGVVVKNYRRITQFGKVMMGKFVSERFREINKEVWANKEDGDVFTRIANAYCGQARWEKSLLHLRERGLIKTEMSDLQYIIPEVAKDLEEECKQEIMDFLWNWARKKIVRMSTKSVPMWYKERLLSEQMSRIEKDTKEEPATKDATDNDN